MLGRLLRVVLCCWLAALAACTVQLVPDYDQALVEGLEETNQEALIFFATVEGGSPADDFPTHAGDYARLIGRFDALRQRAAARYVPPLAARLSDLKIAREFCRSEDDPDACVNVTPASLGELLSTLRTMRDTHRTRGLPTPEAVALFRGRYDIQIDQALTVETALKR